jgi:phosphopantothenoylcysteine decarboxylase
MGNVLLGVTGSVAAIYTPQLYTALKQAGHQVKVVATDAALYFFDPAALDPVDPDKPERNRDVVIVDADEWPGRGDGRHYERSDGVLHIELRRWADVLVMAPLDANTLAKLANGLCDNCLTCVWRAWDRSRPVVLAPAMNTLMWEHPLTVRHLRQLAEDAKPQGESASPERSDSMQMVDWINAHCPKLRIAGPITKRLACDDLGIGAMATAADVIAAVQVALSSNPGATRSK